LLANNVNITILNGVLNIGFKDFMNKVRPLIGTNSYVTRIDGIPGNSSVILVYYTTLTNPAVGTYQVYSSDSVTMINYQEYQKFDIIHFDSNLYKQIRNDTIDYAFLEKLKNIAVILARFDWSDLGNFLGFFKAIKKGLNNNYLSYNAFIQDVKNSHVLHYQSIALVMGLKNAIIINNNGRLVIASKNKLSCLKKLSDNNFKIFKNTPP
jgi:hypothetical protein